MKTLLALLLAIVLAGPLGAQTAVVTRNVNLREGPAVTEKLIRKLVPYDEVLILSPNKDNNYWEVRAATGEHGWVYAPNVEITDGAAAPPPPPAPPPANTVPAVFHGCPVIGTATDDRRQDANKEKNRLTAPATADVDATVTIGAVLQTGDDTQRWNPAHAASIVAYVVNVKKGSEETVNCGDSDLAYRDTHIDVVENPNDTRKSVRMIVEVTPRWRALRGQQGADWSTPALKQQLTNHWVRFTGWLFWDQEHANAAENTRPGRAANWRATAWEIHPVTDIKVCPGTPQTCD